MLILAIDPGNVETAYVEYETTRDEIIGKAKSDNNDLRKYFYDNRGRYEKVVIEQIASYGMAVGETVFETCVWTGRFMEILGPGRVLRVKRQVIKLHHCQSPRAKDANIRQALIDRFGEPGTKKNPGKTYGISKDIWAALAIATWYADELKKIR